MMRGLFNPDNFLWKFFDKIADIFILSILWFIIVISSLGFVVIRV